MLEIAIDALDIGLVRPFWKAITGYADEPGSELPAALIDPSGRGPAIWFQQMDAPRPQRNRIHIDVDVPHERPGRGSTRRSPPAARCSATRGAGVLGAGRPRGQRGLHLYLARQGLRPSLRLSAVITRMSELFLRTLRDDPADAEVPSHKLLIRAGYVRPIGPGLYSWLPLGLRVLRKIEKIVRDEMNAIGGQEILFPALLPKAPYEVTNRWTEYGDGVFRLQDRRRNDYLLGPTHEECSR